jgi:hypothetical protein
MSLPYIPKRQQVVTRSKSTALFTVTAATISKVAKKKFQVKVV